MPTQFKITTPVPTIEETADRLGISDSRLKKLLRLADEIVGKQSKAGKPPAAKKRNTIERRAK